MHALKENHNAYQNEYSEEDRKYQLLQGYGTTVILIHGC